MVGMENFAISTSCLQNRPSTFDITSRLKWLGMMESNHHKQIQSLPHYHYANPQLLKMERVVRFELTTSSLENSYSTNWVTHAKNGGEGGIRTLGGFLVHNSLANCLFRPLRHLTVKSLTNSDFFKGRYYQSSAPLSSGVVLKWRKQQESNLWGFMAPAVFKTVSSTYRTTSI